MNERVLSVEQKQKLESKIQELRSWYLRGRRLWSLAHHLSLYISIVASGAAALVPQLKDIGSETYQKNLASILAAIAALLLSLDAAGGFARKWQASRDSKTKVEQLKDQLMLREPQPEDIERLSQIEEEHDRAITGKDVA